MAALEVQVVPAARQWSVAVRRVQSKVGHRTRVVVPEAAT
jgi:hypothetical protein